MRPTVAELASSLFHSCRPINHLFIVRRNPRPSHLSSSARGFNPDACPVSVTDLGRGMPIHRLLNEDAVALVIASIQAPVLSTNDSRTPPFLSPV